MTLETFKILNNMSPPVLSDLINLRENSSNKDKCRLASVLKTIFHQCVISYTCSQSYSNGSVLSLKQSHQSNTGVTH